MEPGVSAKNGMAVHPQASYKRQVGLTAAA